MIRTAIHTIRKHGLRRVTRACSDIIRVHGLLRGPGVVLRSLAAKRMVGRTSPMPTVRPASPVRCKHRGTNLFDKSVLFVAALDLPQCKKYRVIQREQMFKDCGGMTVMRSEYRDVPRWLSLVQLAGVVYAYRVPDGDEWRQLLRECDRVGVKVIYDIDDPVFDMETVKCNPNLRTLAPAVCAQLARDAKLFLSAMKQASRVCVSTAGLARLARQLLPGIPVHVIPNGIDSESWLHACEPAKATPSSPRGDRPINLLVSSGSLAHDADFEECREGLRRLMEDSHDVALTVCGHADARGICEPSRLTQYPLLPYAEYLRLVAAADLTLVPLSACDFNESKSCVRFLDAAICSTPVIASAVGEYRELISRGVCIGVSSGQEWYQALRQAVDAKSHREVVAARAHEYVCGERRLEAMWKRLDADLLQALVFGRRRHDPASYQVTPGSTTRSSQSHEVPGATCESLS